MNAPASFLQRSVSEVHSAWLFRGSWAFCRSNWVCYLPFIGFLSDVTPLTPLLGFPEIISQVKSALRILFQTILKGTQTKMFTFSFELV